MKLLLDSSPSKYARLTETFNFIGGQLLTPLTRFRNVGEVFAVDNGAFSRFNRDGFMSLLARDRSHCDKCLFVACPDVVGNARRTLEAFRHWSEELNHWPLALVIQDGIDDLEIPWAQLSAIFIGGSTEFKLSKSAADVIRAAQLMEKHTHVGRINTVERWNAFESLGVDTCDGSGVSRFDWMLRAIDDSRKNGGHMPLFAGGNRSESGGVGEVGSELPEAMLCDSTEPGSTEADDGIV